MWQCTHKDTYVQLHAKHARAEREKEAAFDEIKQLKVREGEAEARRAKEALAGLKATASLEAQLAQLRLQCAECEERLADMTHDVADAAQARAFLAEAVAGISKLHRSVTGDEVVYCGVGVSFRIEADRCLVKSIDDSASARKVHAMLPHTIHVGHMLEEVNGQPVRGLGHNAVQDLLVGEAGTEVLLGMRARVDREATTADALPYTVTLKRGSEEESMRTVAARTSAAVAGAASFRGELSALREDVAAKAAAMQRKDEVIAEAMQAREASDQQRKIADERVKALESNCDSLQANLDVCRRDIVVCNQQVVELEARHSRHLEILADEQRKSEGLESALARSAFAYASAEQQIAALKSEFERAQELHAAEATRLKDAAESLQSQLLQAQRTNVSLQDAEKREASLQVYTKSLHVRIEELEKDQADVAALREEVRIARQERVSALGRVSDLVASVRSLELRVVEADAVSTSAAERASSAQGSCSHISQPAPGQTHAFTDTSRL